MKTKDLETSPTCPKCGNDIGAEGMPCSRCAGRVMLSAIQARAKTFARNIMALDDALERETAATSAPREPVCRVHFIERTDAGDKESTLDVLAVVRFSHDDARKIHLLTARDRISVVFIAGSGTDAVPVQIVHWTSPRKGEKINGQVTFSPDGKPIRALIEQSPLSPQDRLTIRAELESQRWAVKHQTDAQDKRANTNDDAAPGRNTDTPKDKPVHREPATATAELESEIIRILSRDFSNLKARPTATDFYHEYVISTRTMAGLHRAKGWALRTMKKRKADIEAHLTRTLGMTVDLDTLRGAPRKAGRLTYKDPTIIERTASDATQPDEE